VIHDGRQPLSTIQGQAALAREAIEQKLGKPILDLDCQDLLDVVHQKLEKVKDAAGLIDILLKRIEPLGGRRKGRPSKVYLNEVIKNAFAHYGQEIEKLGIKVTLPSTDDLVQVDALELQGVLINLVSNSVYWLEQVPRARRSIVVECKRPAPGEVDIIFADSGPGIPASNRASIFEPYFTTKPDGVGLGLVIAGEVIRDYYDGSLELLDSGPLPGAVFRIKLRKRV
jgi:C4-dicarboxylate-specific signal transduction histidine kinase